MLLNFLCFSLSRKLRISEDIYLTIIAQRRGASLYYKPTMIS